MGSMLFRFLIGPSCVNKYIHVLPKTSYRKEEIVDSFIIEFVYTVEFAYVLRSSNSN